jgi:allantoinase
MTDRLDLVIRAARAILPGDGEVPRAIGVRGGKVVAIAGLDEPLEASSTIVLEDDEVLLPGLVDSHVHVNEPGHTDWEGFETATRAAAAGGITTIIDMPLNSIPVTVSTGALAAKRAAAAGKCHIDVGLLGGLIPGSAGELVALHEAGVFGFKCFLTDSGLKEFPPVDVEEMRDALGVLSELGSPLFVHAEIDRASAGRPRLSSRRYAGYLASRPRGFENLAIAEVIEAARQTGGHAHVCHLSSSDALAMIQSAHLDGVNLSVETCPHYLTFCAEEIADGATYFKCGPPIREAENREKLWEGLRSGLIDLVVADHSPSTPTLKTAGDGDFGAAWGGIASVQLTLPAMWTQARERGLGLSDVSRWMSESPAKLVNLRSKGGIVEGHDADFCVLAPEESFVVKSEALYHKNPGTPYEDRRLFGVVRCTILRGERVTGDRPLGCLLLRGEA